MFSNSQKQALRTAFTQVQNRIAYSLRFEPREHQVLVSVSVSDLAGNVLDTIEPASKTSSRSFWGVSVSDNTQFATGIPLNTKERRAAVMAEIAAYVFALANDNGAVINAAFHDEPAYSPKMNYVGQAFLKDGKLTIRQVNVEDRS